MQTLQTTKKYFKTSSAIKIDSLNGSCEYVSHFQIKRNYKNYIELRPIVYVLHLKILTYDIH